MPGTTRVDQATGYRTLLNLQIQAESYASMYTVCTTPLVDAAQAALLPLLIKNSFPSHEPGLKGVRVDTSQNLLALVGMALSAGSQHD